MRKKMGFVFLLIMTFMIGVPIVNAVTTDTNGPTISYLDFTNKTVKPGDKVYLSTDLKDDVSGIDTVYIWSTRKTIDNDTYYGNGEPVSSALKVLYSEKNSPYVIIPDTYIGGSYYVSSIEMWDKEGNRSWAYTSDQMKYYHEMYDYLKGGNASVTLPEDLTFDAWLDNMTTNYEPERTNISINYTVDAATEDNEAPYVAAFDMGERKVNYGETYKFTLKVDDDSDQKIYIIVGLSNGVSMTQYFDVANGSIATFEYTPYVYKTIGKVSIQYVILTDVYGNTGFYLVDGYKGSLAVDSYQKMCKTCETLRDDLYFEVVDDGSTDEEKPVLKDVKINKTEYPIPSIAKVELTATDNKKLADEAQVVFKNGNKTLSATLHLNSNNVYTGELEINQYAEVGDYKLTDVVIGDAAGNGVIYCNYNYKYKDEDLKIDLGFKLTAKFTPDVTTSTTDRDALQKIADAKDGAIIALDATGNSVVQKYLFDEIKGTNKELHIESNGIEWIFNGKDINNVKDIDTAINIYYDYNYSDKESLQNLEKAIVIDFADNGELPGISTVRIKLDYALRDYIGEEVYVYYLDKDDEKMFVDILGNSINLNDNGWYEFKISHNSSYVLTNKKPETKFIKEDKEIINANEELVVKKEETEAEKKPNKKTESLILAIIILTLIIVVIVIILCKGKKEKK